MEGSLKELKSTNNPPVGVKDVMAATLVLLGLRTQEDDWKNVKKQMGKIGENSLLMKMSNVDVKTITPEQTETAKEILKPYSYDKIKSISSAAADVYKWCHKTIEEAGSSGGDKTA